MMVQVERNELPPLPGSYAQWSSSISTSLDGLVGNLLNAQEAQTLANAVPPDFFEGLDVQLRILAFITN